MRIASLSPSVTDLLFRMECGDQIVCRDQHSLHPLEAQEIASIETELRRLLPHEPDIVFVDNNTSPSFIADCKQRNISVFEYNPQSLSGIYDSIRNIGIVLEEEKLANAIMLSMQQALNDTKKKAHLLPARKKVYVQCSQGTATTAGLWLSEIISIAGGIPFFEKERGVEHVRLENVLAYKPDLIVLSFYNTKQDAQEWSTHGDTRSIDPFFLTEPSASVVEGARYIYGWLFEQQH